MAYGASRADAAGAGHEELDRPRRRPARAPARLDAAAVRQRPSTRRAQASAQEILADFPTAARRADHRRSTSRSDKHPGCPALRPLGRRCASTAVELAASPVIAERQAGAAPIQRRRRRLLPHNLDPRLTRYGVDRGRPCKAGARRCAAARRASDGARRADLWPTLRRSRTPAASCSASSSDSGASATPRFIRRSAPVAHLVRLSRGSARSAPGTS